MHVTISSLARELNVPTSRISKAANAAGLGEKQGGHRNASRTFTASEVEQIGNALISDMKSEHTALVGQHDAKVVATAATTSELVRTLKLCGTLLCYRQGIHDTAGGQRIAAICKELEDTAPNAHTKPKARAAWLNSAQPGIAEASAIVAHACAKLAPTGPTVTSAQFGQMSPSDRSKFMQSGGAIVASK